MKKSGADSLHSWMVAVSCCFINIMTFGLSRMSGILFLASMSRFHSTRKQASLPYTLSIFVRSISGPLVGFFGHLFGVRVVTAFGCVLAAVGAGTCFLAENIHVVAVLWGAIFGLGFGFGNTLLPLSINDYFSKYRTTAMGVSYAGAAIGSFILPPIVEAFIQFYGLSGTYLLLAGLLLQCVPAALILKKSNFSGKELGIEELEVERQSIVPANRVRFYAGDDNSQEFDDSQSEDEEILSPSALQIPRIEIENISRNSSVLSYDEKIRRLSTQTLLSNYLVRMSCAGILDIDEIIDSSKSIKKIDKTLLQPEDLCWSQNSITSTDCTASIKNKMSRFSSIQYDKSMLLNTFNQDRKFSLKSSASESEKIFFTKHCDINDKDFYYQTSLGSVRRETLTSSCSIPKIKFTRGSVDISNQNLEIGLTENADMEEENLKSTDSSCHLSNSSITIDLEIKPKFVWCCSADNSSKKDKRHIMSFLLDPIFILITISFACFTLTIMGMLTVIIDFARDIKIETSKEKYIIMTISAANLLGSLGLRWITDYSFLSVLNFTALCFGIQGIMFVATVYSGGFASLIVIVSICGVAQAGLLMIFPIVLAKYVDEDKHSVVIPSNNFLSGPLILAISPSIGYFRDQNGSYDNIFYGFGIISAVCCFSWIIASYLIKRRDKHFNKYDASPQLIDTTLK